MSNCSRGFYPGLSNLAVLWNPNNSSHPPALSAAEASAQSLSLQIRPLEVRAVADLDSVFRTVVQERADGVLFIADPIFFIQLKRMAEFATANRLPAITNFVEFPKFGGLMGYAPSLPDEYRHAAKHVDQILKGANPGDLPVEQPTKFQLVINLKTAKTIGVTVPPRNAHPCRRGDRISGACPLLALSVIRGAAPFLVAIGQERTSARTGAEWLGHE